MFINLIAKLGSFFRKKKLRCVDVQLSTPDNYDWEVIPNHVLYELIKCHEIDQYSATSAVYELERRADPRLGELCQWLIKETGADEFLKDCAREKGKGAINER